MKVKRNGVVGRRLSGVSDPEGFEAWLGRYLEWLLVRNYSELTVERQGRYLLTFFRWCEARSVTRPQEVTKPILERYQRHLLHHRSANGRPLTFGTQVRTLTPVRGYFKWLTRTNVLLWNPASELELPRKERRLPKHVLTAEEAERVLLQAEVTEPLGVRDRAILEVLYSTGLRRREVTKLSLYDVDLDRGTLMVRQGKGKKDRVVPVGERAVAWIRRYLDEVRSAFVVAPDAGALFLTQEGDELSAAWLTERVHRYVDAASLGKTGSCHLFRHTCATLMLEGGADLRSVQEMLGHEQLTTTQIYTRVSIRRLQMVHAETHPSAKLERPEAAKVPKVDERAAADVHATHEAMTHLLASLAVEADEEAGGEG